MVFYIILIIYFIFFFKLKANRLKLNLTRDYVFNVKFITNILLFCFFCNLSKNNFILFTIIYLYFYFYLVSLIRKNFFELVLVYFAKKKSSFFIFSVRFYIAQYFGLEYLKYYIYIKKYFSRLNFFLFPIMLYLYDSYSIILLYIVVSFIFDFDDLNSDLTQFILGLHHNSKIYLTNKGRNKIESYFNFFIFNYLNCYYNNDVFFQKMIYGQDFKYISEKFIDDILD